MYLYVILLLLAASIAFHVAGVFEGITWWNVAVAYVGFIGVLYAFKFMDDIHGMTGLYALAVLLPLLYINHYMEPFAEEQFLAYPIFAASVFLIFNLGSKNVTGDVGSLSIAFWIALAIVMLIAFYPTMGTGIFWILLGVLVLAYLAKFRMLRVVKHLERQ